MFWVGIHESCLVESSAVAVRSTLSTIPDAGVLLSVSSLEASFGPSAKLDHESRAEAFGSVSWKDDRRAIFHGPIVRSVRGASLIRNLLT